MFVSTDWPTFGSGDIVVLSCPQGARHASLARVQGTLLLRPAVATGLSGSVQSDLWGI